ncbi:hypothetical protein CEXT_229441 [Caerostris extrusa]|uniref:Uncharacterized protein n=1 Tax=Caerostris extrusa TaxID=172846 RepID=A0AAV4XAP0_CAEEX|nr:hypothetical protein CEXT_229441 [Caerostris extrusa]
MSDRFERHTDNQKHSPSIPRKEACSISSPPTLPPSPKFLHPPHGELPPPKGGTRAMSATKSPVSYWQNATLPHSSL